MKKKRKDKREVLNDIRRLFAKAAELFKRDKEAANQAIKKARKQAMKERLRLPKDLKRAFCRHCNSYLKPGENARIRIHKSRVIIYCKGCKRFTRIVLPKGYGQKRDKI